MTGMQQNARVEKGDIPGVWRVYLLLLFYIYVDMAL